eukprot:COSAG01_NODE_96_length_26789_cov_36.697089_30_plen_117_part_00
MVTARQSHGSSSAAPRGAAGVIPRGLHAMLSYQWDVQERVIRARTQLQTKGVKCWMDVHGGASTHIGSTVVLAVNFVCCVCLQITAGMSTDIYDSVRLEDLDLCCLLTTSQHMTVS